MNRPAAAAPMKRTMVAAALLALSGCGGGSGGDSGPSGPSPAQGLYYGTTSNGRSVGGLVLSDGNAWVLYSASGSDSVLAGLVFARLSAAGGSFSASGERDYNLEGNGVSNVDVGGSYTEQSSIRGTVDYGGGNVLTFSGAFDGSYNDAPSLAPLVGSWHANAGSPSGLGDVVDFSIDGSGDIAGASAIYDCAFSGHIAPRSDANAFDVSVTFSGQAACAAPGATVTGIAFLNSNTGQLIGAATLGDKSDAILLAGIKR